MKLRIVISDIDGDDAATREFALDEYTTRLLGENVNAQACPSVEVYLIHEERLATVTVPPGVRPR